jgi:7,8-didemethyl-8-hydroxy-5-deazariboflavin synthase CofG subunit
VASVPTLRESIQCAERAVEDPPLERGAALALAQALEREPHAVLAPLLEAGAELGRRGHGRAITVSRNVFIPLTNLCRDRCAYCTFAVTPDSPRAKTYALDEVREIARDARRTRCLEALFCLGDKPELAYRSHRRWLAERGYASTAAYLVDACAVACEEGVFPHTNAGILSVEEMAALRPLNASMGLMLESTSARLRQRGGAHYYCPDKEPELRLRMTREAGALRIPFTSGILIGIGETAEERIDTLFAIRALQEEGGHLQEVIVQNFHPKGDTPMSEWPTPADELMAGTVALARLILGPQMNLQAPPNLSPRSLELLVRSGLNDWGGVSPLTVDFINPEAPWPELEELRLRTEAAGYTLRERLAVYPEWIVERPDFFAPQMLARLRAATDAFGHPLHEETRSELRA